MTSTLVYSNNDTNVNPAGGVIYYALPAPPGYWLPNSECLVNRLPCNTGAPGDACRAAPCSTTAGTSANSWTPSPCKAPSFIQTCEWQTDACAATPPTAACLLGKKIFTVTLAINVPFPFACAAGYLGSNDSAFQLSSDCAGKCPAGSFCPNASTIEAQPCPAGSYCPEGSSIPRPCPPGSYSSFAGLQAASDCTACPAGSSCATGSIAHTPCSPGTVAASGGAELCNKCASGKFQSLEGKTACNTCTSGCEHCLAASGTQPFCPCFCESSCSLEPMWCVNVQITASKGHPPLGHAQQASARTRRWPS